MSHRRLASLCGFAIPFFLTAAVAGAQSNLSVQGFGYPPGQFSSRANGSAGSTGEIDPLSPINPAAIGQFGTRIVYFQMEPEFRSVTANGVTETTTTARYPVVFGAIPLGSKLVMSLGSSTLLDRTATTIFNTTQTISPTESVPMTTQFKVDGALNDIRLAAAWTVSSWLRVGAGLHGFAGHNLVSITQTFADTTVFSQFTQSRILGFGGAAGSVGFQAFNKSWMAAGSFRAGGKIELSSSDTVLGSGHVPTEFGGSLAYTGLAGSFISVRTSHDSWSSLGGLGQSALSPVNTWDTSVGADMAGPHLGSHQLFLRAGVRDRTLPFQASGQDVTEKSIAGGLGTALANGRVLADLAVTRAARSANLPASEHAWIISLGLSVLP
jgi:hypothetical protein